MKLQFYFTLMFLCVFKVSFGQLEAPNVSFPASPTVAELAKYADTPVGYYSGTPNIGLPVYTLNTSGFSLPINLSYHAGGVKVNQEASWVGLGWSLNAGGIITRQIRGIEDFRNDTQIGYFNNFNNYENPLDGDFLQCHSHDESITIGGSVTITYYKFKTVCSLLNDGEPDLFMFNFGGYSGKFIVQRNIDNGTPLQTGKGILLDSESNLKIEFDSANNNQNFKVTTPDGIVYEFHQKEKSQSTSWSDLVLGVPASTTQQRIDSWFLTKIILTNNEEILFNYKIEDNYRQSQTAISESQNIIVDANISSDCLPQNRTTHIFKRHHFSETIQSFLLDSIAWKNGHIKFNTTTRLDIKNNPQKLSNIEVFNSSNERIKKFNFNYGYFNDQYLTGTNEEKRDNLRLKLESINEVGSDNTLLPPYQFNYYEEYELPIKDSNIYDHWGFYNGKYSNNARSRIPTTTYTGFTGEKTFIGADRHADLGYAKTATLESMVLPTGGTINYEYELNRYFDELDPVAQTHNISGFVQNYMLYAEPFTMYDGGQIGSPNYFEFEVTNAVNEYTLSYDINKEAFDLTINDQSTHPIYLELFKVDNGIETSISYLTHNDFPNEVWGPNEPIKNYYKKFTSPLSIGTYRLRFNWIPAHLINGTYNTDPVYLVGDIDYTEDTTNLITSVDAGGLRIKKISSPKNTREFKYETFDTNLNQIISSGKLITKGNYTDFFGEGLVCSGSGSSTFTFMQLNSNSNIPITGTISGNIVGYSEVTELVTNNNESPIKNSYTYENNIEVVNFWNAPNQPNIKNGRLLKEIKYLNSEPIQEIAYQYTRSADSIKAVNYVPPTELYAPGRIVEYTVPSELHLLTEKMVKTYDANDSIVTQSTYAYGGTTHNLPKIITSTQSDGKMRSIKNYYPEDIATLSNTTTTEITSANALKDAYRVNIPIQSKSSLLENNTEIPISTQRISFKQENSLIAPEFFKDAIGTDGFKTHIQYTRYDSSGNILETYNPNNNTYTSYIWSYNKMYPVAKIENASFQTVASALGITETALSNFDKANLTSLATLRTHASLNEAFVTTYIYKELIGIESITDPREQTTTYHYDAFNRLDHVTDHNGKMLSKNEYYYKNQQ